MFESNPQTPLIDLKGNLIHINFDNSESSTKESNLSRENSKCYDDTIEEQINFQKNEKIIQIKNKKNILSKKTKRDKLSSNNKKKSAKCKIISNLFNEFKTCSKSYKEFNQFHFIEKKIKNDLYSSPAQLASEVRNVFSQIFSKFHDFDKYNKTLIYCELFENIYKKYDNNKTLTKKCKNLVEVINKLKRELRQTELSRNIQLENKNYSNKNNNYFYSYQTSQDKFRLQLNEINNNENAIEKSVKKYKNEIGNKISKLNHEQKKGILGIISNNCVGRNIQNSIMEININKMTYNQLKELDKYVNRCIKENNSSNCSPLDKSSEISNRLENEDEYDILKNDDLSSCLSDDDEDEEE